MHKVTPGQKVRILTVQLAVPADANPSSVADEMTDLLTGATAEDTSNILDWQYLGCTPETGEIVTAADDPEEGEIFSESPSPQKRPTSFAVTAFGNSPTLIRMDRLDVLLTTSQVIALSRSLLETLETKGKHGDFPARILLTLNGAYTETGFQEALDAELVVRAAE